MLNNFKVSKLVIFQATSIY